MAISAQCPHCFAKLKLKNPDLVGKKVRCPSCQEPFRVEAPADTPAPTAAPAKRGKTKETTPPAGDDDWLNDLNSYGDESAESSSVAAAPPVIGRKKKEKKPKSRKVRSRDEYGEYPLAVHRLMMIGTGLLGGLIGAVIWGCALYWMGSGARFLSILVGVLVGMGVRLGASRWDYGWWPALTAVAIAIFSIISGNIMLADLFIKNETSQIRSDAQARVEFAGHENVMISSLADDIAFQWEEQGRDFEWPDEYFDDGFDPESLPKQYPSEIWAEATQQWMNLPENEKQVRRDQQRKEAEDELRFEEGAAELFESGAFNVVTKAVFILHPLNLLWLAIACTGAFKIAAGWDDDD